MKKITVYKTILVMLVITALVLATFIIKKYIEGNKIESNIQSVLQEIKKEKQSNPNQIDVIKEIDEEIEGYKVVGIINIPKINIAYPILEKTNKESLKLSITKFWGEKINQKGNVVLAGHNNLNNKMFGKIDRLENGDIIELTDSQMVAVEYQVFDKYIIDPNDINCIFPVEENTREVTLITCTNRDKNRLVVKAREII